MWKIIFAVLSIVALSSLAQAQRISLDSPVIDAKQNYKEGNVEFAGMQWEGKLLLPGVAAERQALVREQYSINVLNRAWERPDDTDYVKGKEHQVKRYANRYNLMMEKLIKEDKLEKARRYRY